MSNLLNSSTYLTFVTIAVFVVIFTVVITVVVVYRAKNKINERLQRMSDVAYTEILGSSGGESGSVVTYGNNGPNFGMFAAASTTKFLVVYLNGEREIVSVDDNSKLCKAYLLKLKQSNTEKTNS